MDNRMRSNLMRGRSIVNDSSIHSYFAQLTNYHANVLSRITKLETERGFFEIKYNRKLIFYFRILRESARPFSSYSGGSWCYKFFTWRFWTTKSWAFTWGTKSSSNSGSTKVGIDASKEKCKVFFMFLKKKILMILNTIIAPRRNFF